MSCRKSALGRGVYLEAKTHDCISLFPYYLLLVYLFLFGHLKHFGHLWSLIQYVLLVKVKKSWLQYISSFTNRHLGVALS